MKLSRETYLLLRELGFYQFAAFLLKVALRKIFHGEIFRFFSSIELIF